jgi:WD40 repeat protein
MHEGDTTPKIPAARPGGSEILSGRMGSHPDRDSAQTVPGTPPSIPGHELIKIIGRGSYGDVWLARNMLGTYRAIKIVYRARFDDERPYERELSGIKKFEPLSRAHEGLVDVLQVGRDDDVGCYYYVMELADDASGDGSTEGNKVPSATRTINPEKYCARTLGTDIQRRGRLPVSECVQRGLALSIALEYLHEQGLVHRDIKPSNIIFVNGTPKLADIGLVADAASGGSLVGTVGFMPPEGPGTAQADVYSLGKVLYELSTGKDREHWPNPMTEIGIIEDRHEWLELNEVMARACEPDPKRRYSSASELRSDLALLLGGKSVVRLRRLERFWKRVLYATPAAIAGVLGLGLLIVYRGRLSDQKRAVELTEARLSRSGVRRAGWSVTHAFHTQRAGKLRLDDEFADEAAVGLAGLDLRLVTRMVAGGSSVAFDPGGNVLFGGLRDGTGHLLRPGATNFNLLAISGDGPVAFTADGRQVQFVSTNGGKFLLRNLLNGQVLREFHLSGEPNTGYDEHSVLAMTADASLAGAAVNAEDGGRFSIWELASGKELGSSVGLATAMAFAPDGRAIATGFDDGQISVRALPEFKEIARLGARRAKITCLAFGRDPNVMESSSNSWLLAGGDDAAGVVIYQLATSNVVSKLRGSAYDLHALAFRSDGTILAGAGREDVRFWDVATEELILRMKASELDNARGLAWSIDDRRFGVATETAFNPATINVWDVEDGRGIASLRGLAAPVQRVWWSGASRKLAALSDDWDVAVWNAQDSRLTHLLHVPVGKSADNAAAAFSADENRLAFAAGSRVQVYNLQTRTLDCEWKVPLGYCESVRFDKEGRVLFLHCEKDSDESRRRTWALYRLVPPTTVVPLFRQEEVNWRTWGTSLPREGDWFLVWGGMTNGPGSDVLVMGLSDGKLLHRLPIPRYYNGLELTLNPAGTLVACPTTGPEAFLYSLPNAVFAGKFPSGHTAMTQQADRVADAVENLGGWQVLNLKNRGRLPRLAIDVGQPNRPEFSPDGTRLAMPTGDGRVLVANFSQIDYSLR